VSRSSARSDAEPADTTSSSTETTVIARTVTRIVVPGVLVTAIAFLLQGHNLPGGGFIAGVLTAAGFGLVYVVFGRDYARRTLLRTVDATAPFDGSVGAYVRAFGVGLALAASTGLAFMLLGGNFLTQLDEHDELVPVYEEIEVPTALAFDLGVYFAVVGALLTILSVVGAE